MKVVSAISEKGLFEQLTDCTVGGASNNSENAKHHLLP